MRRDAFLQWPDIPTSVGCIRLRRIFNRGKLRHTPTPKHDTSATRKGTQINKFGELKLPLERKIRRC